MFVPVNAALPFIDVLLQRWGAISNRAYHTADALLRLSLVGHLVHASSAKFGLVRSSEGRLGKRGMEACWEIEHDLHGSLKQFTGS